MACGLPVICSTESQHADLAAARYLLGVSIDLADPAGTARRIAPLLAAPVDARDRSAMADYAIRVYSWPAMAGAVAAMAGSLVSPRSPQ